MTTRMTKIGVLLASALILASCANMPKPFARKDKAQSASTKTMAEPQIGVNKYLWRGALETLDFMPMSQIDPFGGTILTEWYSNPEAPSERFKVNVYILDTQLRADALKVGVFKQAQGPGGWADAPVDADTARQIENAILTRARELYIASN